MTCILDPMCKDCRENPRTSGRGPRCIVCDRKYNALKARNLRIKKKQKLLQQNNTLKRKGQRICSRCLKVRHLSEFSTSMGNRKGKINQLCDECLSKMYLSPNRINDSGFTYGVWRRRAYALNSNARHRLSREECKIVHISELPFIFKPQDMLAMFNAQNGKCFYCKIDLTTKNAQGDHRIPLSRNGTHEPTNVVLVCADCNRLKFTKTEEEFLQFIGEYTKRFAK